MESEELRSFVLRAIDQLKDKPTLQLLDILYQTERLCVGAELYPKHTSLSRGIREILMPS